MPSTHENVLQNPLDQHRFELLVNAISNYAIYMLDANGCIVSWNTAAQRFKGYAGEEILGKHFSVFYTEEDRIAGQPDKALAAARETGRFEQEGWRLRKNGERFRAAVVVNPIRDQVSGELIGYAKVTRDLTERLQHEASLEQARAAIAQSQKMEALGQFTGGVAHDFNNFLTVIVNNLEIIQHQTQDPQILRLVESAHRAADRGARLTRQLLAFARRQPLRPEPHDINALIREFESLLRRACPSSIRLELDLAQSLAVTEVDGPQFESALLNLVVNASDATPSGGVVTVRTSNAWLDAQQAANATMPLGRFVVVSVADQGVGMSHEVQEHAFEPFFTTKDVGKGSGLGLSQVEGFVSQSGGFVRLQSAPGVGTTVSIHLPASGPAVEVVADNTADGILVVEDDPDVMEIAVEIFRGLGYRVLTAGNAIDALDILKSDAPLRLMFSDIVMPGGLNGVQLAQQARQLRPDVGVVLTSGYPQRLLSEDMSGLKDFIFIAKPYRLAELANTVRLAVEPDH